MEPVTLPRLLALALPAMASVFLNNAYRIVDQYAVQWLGTESQAAIGSTTFILIATYAMFMVVSSGVGPLAARSIGSGDRHATGTIVGRGIAGSAVMGVLFCLIMAVGDEAIPAAIGLEGMAATEMATYLRWLGYTGFFFSFGPLVDAVFIASGNTALPMKLQLLSTLLNALLNWLLIYKLGLGIAGAAIASGISRAAASTIGLVLLWRNFHPELGMDGTLVRIANIGSPLAMGTAGFALAYWVLLKIVVSPMGASVYAALGIGFSVLEGCAWPLYAGTMMAISSLVGRQLGAGAHEELDRTLRLAFPTATALGLFFTLAMCLGAEEICSRFTQDPETLREAVLYSRIIGISQIFVAYESLAEGVLAGAGATRAVFWASTPLNVLRIPLAWLLAFALGMGSAGIWWAIVATTLAKSLLKLGLVWRGDWRDLNL
jgi:putative MATE family efflux protein